MIISVSVFKIYKEYLDFTLHYLAGIIWKWLNIHCPFDLNGKPAGSGPFVGAIGGPCNGHLSLSQVWLVEPLDVEQKNSSPWSEQTWAPSPKQKILSATMLICQCTKPQCWAKKSSQGWVRLFLKVLAQQAIVPQNLYILTTMSCFLVVFVIIF